jgi:transposase
MLGRRPQAQQELWVATTDLVRGPGHALYEMLNALLAEAGFDRWVEDLCEPYSAAAGRPGIPPGVYFRMTLAGYFEGISAQRAIAWRCADSLSLKGFLEFGPTEETPHHSSLTNCHQRLPLEVHDEVFRFVLDLAAEQKLLKGLRVGVDATTLEANAALKSLVRGDTLEDYPDYLRRLAEEQGVEIKSDDDLRRFDQQRKDKSLKNDEWVSESDPAARITQMKDGTTHLAYKAEHTVDLDTDVIVSVQIAPGDAGDTTTLPVSLETAETNLLVCGAEHEIREVATDKGYHSAELIHTQTLLGRQMYIREPRRRCRRKWIDKPVGDQLAVYANRRRMRGAHGTALHKKRSELCERSFAHVCETGGARRCWLRGLVTVTKRYLIQVAARNLSVILRKLFGLGTPRGLNGLAALVSFLQLAVSFRHTAVNRLQNFPSLRLSTFTQRLIARAVVKLAT